MKHIVLILFTIFLLLLLSCDRPQDPCEGLATGPQPTVNFSDTHDKEIDVLIYTTGVRIDIDKLNYDINGKFFSRYGFKVNFIDAGTIDYDRTILYRDFNCNVPTLYIVKDWQKGNNGCLRGNCMFVIDSRKYTSTVAHEIGHLRGLWHVGIPKNIMYRYQSVCIPRIEFNEEQINRLK